MDILVKFRYDKERVFHNVVNYGRIKDCDPFFFIEIETSNARSFIPIAQVVFIGPYDHWYGEPYNEEDYK